MNERVPPPPLALVGCDFRVASTAWRGALALAPEERRELARALEQAAQVRGLVVLETCNRTEWIVETDEPAWAASLLQSWMRRLWAERGPDANGGSLPEPYRHLEGEAARHAVRVAAGLESFVPGEREIAAQVNRALETARADGTATPLLNELGQAAARTVRRVEKDCAFRDSGRGVHSLAVERLGRLASCLRRRPRVGVAGLGAIGRRTAELLEQAGLPAARLFNRTIPAERASTWTPLAELPERARELDALIVATGARQPLLEAARLAAGRDDAPLLVVDLGSPAQVRAPRQADSPVIVEGLDDLLVTTLARPSDEEDRRAAERLVEEGLDELLLAWRKSPAGALLRRLQESRDELGAERLPALLDEHLADLPEERRRRLERALRGLVLERDRHLLEHLRLAVIPPDRSPSPGEAGGAVVGAEEGEPS